VCRFDRWPRAFTGAQRRVHHADGFRAIEPVDSSVVFFRSRSTVHGITNIHFPSSDFTNGRFAINSWVHRADTVSD